MWNPDEFRDMDFGLAEDETFEPEDDLEEDFVPGENEPFIMTILGPIRLAEAGVTFSTAAFTAASTSLFAGIGSQYFYPTESTLTVWAAMLLALRVHVEERRAQAAPEHHRIMETTSTVDEAEVAYAHGGEALVS